MTVTIFHNPRCSKSRETLALIQSRGITPEIVHYLDTPPDQATLKRIIEQLDLPAQSIVRTSEADYAASGLTADSSTAEVIEALASTPRLMERPIVLVDAHGQTRAAIGRPPSAVEAILP
ncbi:MAG: arsenate reductase (glutaredoxin) [Wenzhouxiangella sp.]